MEVAGDRPWAAATAMEGVGSTGASGGGGGAEAAKTAIGRHGDWPAKECAALMAERGGMRMREARLA